MLKAPNNTHEYLIKQFGDYMLFPKWGILNHNEGRGPLSTWAARNNIDMDEVLEKLRRIERFFRS